MGIVVLAVGLVIALVRPGATMWVAVLATLFGGSAAISLPALGGATVAPAYLSLGLLAMALFLRGRLTSPTIALTPDQPGFFLGLLMIWAVAAAVLLPRLFAGDVEVIPLSRGGEGGPAVGILVPNSGNITQSVYALGGLATFCLTTTFVRMARGYERFGKAMLVLAGLNLLAAAVDQLGYYAGLGNLLEPFHTAGYNFMTESTVGGFIKRINGTFSEASAFAGFTLPLFAFCYGLYRRGIQTRATGTLAALSLVAVLLATSTAGYVGLGLYLALIALRTVWQAVAGGGRRDLAHALRMSALGLVVVAVIAVLAPVVVEQARLLFESMIVNKVDSDSADERGMWNAVSFEAFLGSWGLGTGLGSTRASSYPIVLLSNLGVPGAFLFLAFVVAVFRVRPPPAAPQLVHGLVAASKHGMLSVLLIAAMVGTVFDLPMLFYMFCGVICSVPIAFPRRRPLRRGLDGYEPLERAPVAGAGSWHAA